MPDDERVAVILGDWCDRCERGESIDPEAVISAHPDLAEDLRDGFAALDAVDRVLRDLPASSTADPVAIGPYRVLRRLGSGGMGTVYLAADDAEAPVALKVVHPQLLERPGFFKRFLREAELGKRVDDENVVRTLNVDAVRIGAVTTHFLVMEYVKGRTLRQLLDDLGTVPEALLRKIGMQAAAGLDAIHTAGIVHRDLKPENVLITDDHRVRIMDLGVAKGVDASTALTRDGQFAGSLLYAAPEQFKRSAIGPAADLYSLGVLLYELATGQNPFSADGAAAVMNAHLQLTPPPLNERNTELSPLLTEILTTLLAKTPSERFASAGELRDVFARGEQASWWAEREAAALVAAPRVVRVPVRRETALHGRESDLELLRRAWHEARDGQGSALLLEGEAGIGKTRLMDAFIAGLDENGATVLYGSYPPSGGLGGLSDAILEHFGAAGLEEALAPYLRVTPRLVPAFAALVKHEAMPEGGEPVQGDALHSVFVQLMRALSEESPLLWVVEDLHFAHSDSRRVLHSLVRALEDHPVLLILTTRPELPEDELAELWRVEHVRRMGLDRLSAREVILLLKDAFKSQALAEKLGGKIALKSDGVPFFVFEMIRGLKEGQFITELPDGSFVESKMIEEIEVPSAVKDLIEVRLHDLTNDERALLDAGSVQGYEFDPDLLAAVLDRRPLAVLQDLAAIERRGGVVLATHDRYRFDHHQIQEVVSEALPPALRREYHALLAEALAARKGGAAREPEDVPGETALFMAWHHAQGSRPRRGVPFLVPAFRHLQAGCRYGREVQLARHALSDRGALSGAARVGALLRLNHGLHFSGRAAEQRPVLEEALQIADGLGDASLRAEVGSDLGWLTHTSGSQDRALELLEEGLALAREAGAGWLEAQITGNLGNVRAHIGESQEACRLLERQRALGVELGDRWSEQAGLDHLGQLLGVLGRFDEARELLERALAIARERADRSGQAITAGNLARVLWDLGRYDEARDHFIRALDLATEIGFRGVEATVRGGLGMLEDVLGHFEAAREHYERELALYREMGRRDKEGEVVGNLGLLHDNLGHYADALAHHRRYLALASEAGGKADVAVALVNLGDVLSALGDPADARAHLRRSLAICRELGMQRVQSYALHRLGRAAERTSDPAEARRRFAAALELRRELGYRRGVSESLLALGGLEAAEGLEARARPLLEEARALAIELGLPEKILLASAHCAVLPGGSPAGALEAWDKHAHRVGHALRMEARFVLWQATNDPAHLEEAKRLLDHLVEHAPEECRESMLENVPLNGEIMEAWAEHGERTESAGDDD